MRTSLHHQSEAQPPNGPLTAATSPDTPSTCPATQSGLPQLRCERRESWTSKQEDGAEPAVIREPEPDE
jgi:hypothetical protein